MGKKLRFTHLHDWHAERAKMVEFVGYHMPIWYNETGIVTEHMSVRQGVGIFDVTHMGRFMFSGSDAEDFLNYVTTNNVFKLSPSQGQYSTICNKDGGIIDDLIIYKLDEKQFFVIVNSANKEKDFDWFKSHGKGYNVKMENISDSTPQFAVQGPKAVATLQKLTDDDLSGYSSFGDTIITKLAGHQVIATRTGYTGEDGFEISQRNVPLTRPPDAIRLWEEILNAGKEFKILPIGLGARDTLRLEAGMPLHGSDIDETTTPLEARLRFVVKLKKEDFIGREALLKQKEEGVKRFRVGLIMIDKGIPRPHYDIFNGGEKIGETTSGNYSPLLPRGQGVALGYVKRDWRTSGTMVRVAIHGKRRLAEVIGPRKMLGRLKARATQL
ncbi:MAG: glycine cleavage system aminomethyltransferase GcvT [Promethearchaeota archaeon]